MSSTQQRPQTTNRTFFGHPLGLANLAGVEMWERFSFYGMQGILLYYLYYAAHEGGLGIAEPVATSIVGAYGGAVYLSAVLGAWVADRLLGAERTLTFGAVIIMAGHIALAVLPGAPGVGVGLFCVAIGSGTLKTTTSSVLGDLYTKEDRRRDAAFSIYYMGVNIGAFAGPLLTGVPAKSGQFHLGFGLAAVGMAVGLVQYLVMRRSTLGDAGKAVNNPLDAAGKVRYGVVGAVVVVAIVVLTLTGVITAGRLSSIVVGVTAVAAIALFAVMLTSSKITAVERRRVVSFIPMFLASGVFWALFQQWSTVVAIYADKRTDLSVGGWEVPATWVGASIEPAYVIVLAGVFAALWTALGKRDKEPTSPIKFSLGTTVMGVAFLLFLPFSGSGEGGTPVLWVAFILLVFALAELSLSPVGQSLSTKLAPDAFHTQMIALFFLSVALGTSAAGTLAGRYDPANEVPYFLVIGGASIVVGLLMFAFSKPIGRLMSGVH